MALVAFDGQIRFNLPRHVAAEVEVAESFRRAAESQDDGGGELVFCGAAALEDLEHVDAVPGGLCGSGALFEEDDACEAVVEVPEVDG